MVTEIALACARSWLVLTLAATGVAKLYLHTGRWRGKRYMYAAVAELTVAVMLTLPAATLADILRTGPRVGHVVAPASAAFLFAVFLSYRAWTWWTDTPCYCTGESNETRSGDIVGCSVLLLAAVCVGWGGAHGVTGPSWMPWTALAVPAGALLAGITKRRLKGDGSP